MNSITIEIPEEYARSFGQTEEEARKNAKLELAIEMYREGNWSTGKAAHFAGLYIGRFMDLLRDRGISRQYTERMLEQDINYAGGCV